MTGIKRPAGSNRMVQKPLSFGAPSKKAKPTASSPISKNKIFCDMDGVLTDFDKAVKDICGKTPDELPQGQMWSKITATPNFYQDMEWTTDGQDLWEAIRPLQPDILTGMPRAKSTVTAAQKAAWCKRELCVETAHVNKAAPKWQHDFVSGFARTDVTNVITCWSRNKHCESGPKRVLIDDRQKFQEDWEAAGGIFILHTDTVSTLRKLREKGILPDPTKAGVTAAEKEPESEPAATAQGEKEQPQASKKVTAD